MIQIKHRLTGDILFESEKETIKEAVIDAVEQKANLSRANLFGADLSGANLYGADLSGADLYGANLSRAYHIVCFGPVGDSKRIGYAVDHDNKVMFQLGCWWGDYKSTLARITEEYADGPMKKCYLQGVKWANAQILAYREVQP